MKAKSIKGKKAAEIKTALESNMTDGFTPTIAVVFISAESELDAVRNLLTEKNIQIFGASSGTLFIDGDIEDNAIAILLLDMNTAYFHVQLLPANGASKFYVAEEVGKTGKKLFNNPSFLIVSGGLTTDGDEILEGIENIAGKDATLFGGLAADTMKMERTYVFTNEMISDNGLVALIFDEEKISLTGLAHGGWKPVGNEKTITGSSGNIVYTIDGEPAIDLIARYSGLKSSDFKNETAIALASNFQLQLKRENKHPVMRTPMYLNRADGSIVFAGSLPQGSKVSFCLLPGFEVIDEAKIEFTEYKNQEPEADALIMFSCAGRQLALGLFVCEEINNIKSLWNVPMAGFFCFGEIGKVKGGKNEFHNMTCSLAILKEK